MYQVLALDLDGTVLNHEHKIHPEVKAAIRAAKEACHVVIVTGRHHTAVKPYYEELGLDTPVICCNGTYIYDYQHHQVIKESALEKDIARQFHDLAIEHGMKMVLYTTHAMMYSRTQPVDYMHELAEWAQQYGEHIRPDIRQIDSFKEEINNADYVWKFVIEGEPENIARLQGHALVKEYFSGERSWLNRVDFARKGNSKGGRLAEYLQEKGYLPEQVIAIGDNHNDISMIQLAGLGVAMKNADDTVKAAADMICLTDNNSDGIARLIREKIKR
ncbi:Cof-type HAD-IIB family hydrolase [Vibrio sp. HA2012]|uniref:Cof-type HAD-IIB family hydrolase n=1 Tax=Vibrio sp. HA2012 TaxID=1971595 RepID=UPI000C2C1D9E|nr:Cof-type HAD-IIB family hydrolase [Vibrio sp. HA2012]PJC87115.1 Cof-type HAD-IIB family hydrolase [Vibrio sp. HA2012]